MKKPASKFAKPAQIQPKSQFLFHKNLPPRNFSLMTLLAVHKKKEYFVAKYYFYVARSLCFLDSIYATNLYFQLIGYPSMTVLKSQPLSFEALAKRYGQAWFQWPQRLSMRQWVETAAAIWRRRWHTRSSWVDFIHGLYTHMGAKCVTKLKRIFFK